MEEDFWKKYILENPMLVDEISDWEIAILCAECGVEIEKTHSCLFEKSYTYMHEAKNASEHHKCPHCLAECKLTGYYDYNPLPVKKVKTRYIFLEKQEYTWWGGKKKRKHFIDRQPI